MNFAEQLKALEALGLVASEEGQGEDPGLSGGQFEPNGFVVPLVSGLFHQFYTDVLDLAQDAHKDLAGTFLMRPKGQGRDYLFRNTDKLAADEAFKRHQSLGGQTPKVRSYAFVFQRDACLSWSSPEAKANWQELIMFDVPFVTFRSKNYAAYNLLVAPSIVAALSGLDWDYSELTRKPQSIATDTDMENGVYKNYVQDYTDEHVFNLVGSKDRGWQDSVFFKRRAALWASLGCDKPEVMDYQALNPVDQKMLRTALEVASTSKGLKEQWGKIALVYDPHGSYKKNDGNLGWRQIPILLKLYKSQAEAQADVDQAKARREGGNTESPFTPDMVKSENSNGVGDELKSRMRETKAAYLEGVNGPAPIAKRTALAKMTIEDENFFAKEYGFNKADLEAAWDTL